MKNRLNIVVKQGALLAIMARRNLNRTRLAKSISASETYVGQIVNGEVAPGPDIRSRILEALGCSFEDIFLLGKRTSVQSHGTDARLEVRDN